ncbi:hypothetical protein VTN77DRAFT_7845 [Rasamsonia byssochlamydoides]|uniref:uncharacterized protein n=1 Tax=Rasamsonia byssochlamydoides TaxID=89139 RepID=UPI00374384A4
MSTELAVPTTDADWDALISTIKDALPESRTLYPNPVPSSIAKTIDHTQLSPTVSERQIDSLCSEAREFRFATICVRSPQVAHVASHLKDTSDVGISCVVGFPEGTQRTTDKVNEAKMAVGGGATEVDMVINYPLLKEGKYTDVYNDVLAVRKVVPSPIKLKAILETSDLTRDEMIAGCVVSSMAGADFVQTSSGYRGVGASVENIRLMRETVDRIGKGCKVKGSGGITSADQVIAMLKSGADRIGMSASVKVMKELAGDIEAASIPQGVY